MENHNIKTLSKKVFPKVFISYSWEDEEHRKWVRQLTNCLLENGIDATLDQYDLSLGDRLPEFMEKSISEADYVLIICTPAYKKKSDNRQGGVGYEGHIISGELVSAKNERKFIPVIRKGDINQSIPTILSAKLGADLRDGDEYNANFEKLLNTLYGINPKPPIGRNRINTITNQSDYVKTMDSVDIVFCIDGTESMRTLKDIKGRVVHFYQDVRYQLEKKKYYIGQIRARIILFRDYLADGNKAMLVTNFYNLPQQTLEFDEIINSIEPIGGGDDLEDGLEALAYAIRSEWCREANRKRQIILLWSDEAPHFLGYGKKSKYYPKGMARDFDELTQWWNNEKMISQNAKRLLLFTPYKCEWQKIANCWNNVLLFAVEEGKGLRDIDYENILSAITNVI